MIDTLPRPRQWLATVRVTQGKVRVTAGESIMSRGEQFLQYPFTFVPSVGVSLRLTVDLPPGYPRSVHLELVELGPGRHIGHHILMETVYTDDPDEVLDTARLVLAPEIGDDRVLAGLLLKWGGAV